MTQHEQDIEYWKIWAKHMEHTLMVSRQREYTLEARLKAVEQTWWYRWFAKQEPQQLEQVSATVHR